MNDIARARQARDARKKKWRTVTNELVASHANPDCKACAGSGFVGKEGDEFMCPCAEELFAVAYNGRLRWNEGKRRVEVFV